MHGAQALLRDSTVAKYGSKLRLFSPSSVCRIGASCLPPQGCLPSRALLIASQSLSFQRTPLTLIGQISEAREFWQSLHDVLRRTPSHRAVVIGIDANADFYTADEEATLIGDVLATGEPHRNDDMLLELCLTHGLEAPGTFRDIQAGPTWTWQQTSGKLKRIDHLLFPARAMAPQASGTGSRFWHRQWHARPCCRPGKDLCDLPQSHLPQSSAAPSDQGRGFKLRLPLMVS